MTAAEHAAQVVAVSASLLMGESRSERHGVYARRRPRIVAAVCPECAGSGVDPLNPGERCIVCEGRPGATG
jgi:hypothetical protein